MTMTSRAHAGGCREGGVLLTLLSSRSLFLAAAASSCSAASCFSFSSSWRFRTATGSPFCVACQGGVAHQWGSPTPDPSPPPHTHGILPSAPGEPACPKTGRLPSPPHLPRVGRAAGDHDGAGSPTVCQVSWMMPAFSVRISMSCWASPSLNTMLLRVDTSVL